MRKRLLMGRNDFETEEGIKESIRRSRNFDSDLEDPSMADALLLFSTIKQRTWLIATNGRLYCILDDTGKDEPHVNWSIPKDQLVSGDDVSIEIKFGCSRRGVGRVDIGKYRNWLYSIKLFEQMDVVSSIRQLIRRNMIDEGRRRDMDFAIADMDFEEARREFEKTYFSALIRKYGDLSKVTLVAGIDRPALYKKLRAFGIMRETRVFVSYAHQDEYFSDKLEEHLDILKHKGVITTWHDRRITAGKEWKEETDKHLDTAQIILLLISADFFASDYCMIEMKRAMERHEAGEARVIPIILHPVRWESAPFSNLQALPKDAKAISLWEDQEEAFTDIVEGIQVAVEEIKGG